MSIARNININKAVYEALDKVILPDLTGKRILLKPNVAREVGPCLGLNTNPEVVRAVFHYLKSKYAATFYIGDSPIVASDTHKAFELSGYHSLLAEDGLQYLNLDEPDPVVLPIPQGKILKKIKITGYWHQFDYIISIPVLKMHMHTGASLSFKNCKGLIYRKEKVTLHHQQAPDIMEPLQKLNPRVKELDIAIADLANVIRPDLAVIDASFALEGLGPSAGSPRKLDTIIASTDYLAADIVALAIGQPSWTLARVPHLEAIAQQRGTAGPQDLNGISTDPEDITPFQVTLQEPPSTITIQYPNVTVIDRDSCSSCGSTLYVFLQHHKDFIDANFTPDHPLNLIIGKGIRDVDLYEPSFLIGNCTASRRKDGIFIKGCAPVESVIRTTIEDYLQKQKKASN